MKHKYFFGYSKKFSEKWQAMKKRQAQIRLLENVGVSTDDMASHLAGIAKIYEYPKVDAFAALGVNVEAIESGNEK